MTKKIRLLAACVLMIFTIMQLGAGTHHFDDEGFCIQSTKAKVIDLRTDQANITGYTSGLQNGTGRSLSMGDVNADGIADWLIGVPGEGAAESFFVVYGRPDFPPDKIIHLEEEPANIILESGTDTGFATTSGDINGDGIDDIITTAPKHDLPGRPRGRVFIVYGSEDFSVHEQIRGSFANLTIIGAQDGDHIGVSVAVGDVNHDAIDDVLIGAPLVSREGEDNVGESYVIYGSKEFPSKKVIDLSKERADVTIRGEDAGNFLGNTVFSSDVNGDGKNDILVGARHAREKGAVYVFYGKESHQAMIDLATERADVTILGEKAEDQFGYDIASGDVNGDGIGDLLVAARYADLPGRTNAGKAYVLYGRDIPSDTIIDLATMPADVYIHMDNENVGEYATIAVFSGDINANGVADILVGGTDPHGGTRDMRVYVYYGKKDFEPDSIIDVTSQEANLTVYDDVHLDWDDRILNLLFEAPLIAFAVGDLNADFVNDIAIGLPTSNFLPLTNGVGKAIVLYGEGCPCEGLLEIKPGNNKGELKHGCSPGTWKIGQKEIGWNGG